MFKSDGTTSVCSFPPSECNSTQHKHFSSRQTATVITSAITLHQLPDLHILSHHIV